MKKVLNDPKFLYMVAGFLFVLFLIVASDIILAVTTPRPTEYKLELEKPVTLIEEYQGPIPQGYDLDHFRKTGETIKEVKFNG